MLLVENFEVLHSQIQHKTITIHIENDENWWISKAWWIWLVTLKSFNKLLKFTNLHHFLCRLSEAHFHRLLKCLNLWHILFDVSYHWSCNTCTVLLRYDSMWWSSMDRTDNLQFFVDCQHYFFHVVFSTILHTTLKFIQSTWLLRMCSQTKAVFRSIITDVLYTRHDSIMYNSCELVSCSPCWEAPCALRSIFSMQHGLIFAR